MLKVALGQFAVSRVWEENAQVCVDLMERARAGALHQVDADLGVLFPDAADGELAQSDFQHDSSLWERFVRRIPGFSIVAPTGAARRLRETPSSRL